MRFEVPQFIEIEDKIFGPFTWKQFVYLTGGVGALIITFLFSKILFVIIGLPVGAVAAALAFYPVNNRPFSIFLESMFRFYKSSRTYHWRKADDIVYRDRPQSVDEKPNPYARLAASNDINSLSRKLELNAIQKEEHDSQQ